MAAVTYGIGIPAQQVSDAAIIRESRSEPERFAAIFDRHYGEIHAYAARRLGPGLADDVAAETFLVAFTLRGRYDVSRPDARPWLFGIALPVPATLPAMSCREVSRVIYDAPMLPQRTRVNPARWTALTRAALSCGLFKLDGRQRVDDVNAIKLTATPKQHGVRETLWVHPKTFLPVRISFGPRAATADFLWLPPTAANLAGLRVTLPALAAPHRLPAGTGILFWQVVYLGK